MSRNLVNVVVAGKHPAPQWLDIDAAIAHHGYPSLIHRLVYSRTHHSNFHVRGYIEEGTTTTPFDMAVRNRIDRFHLVADMPRYVPALQSRAAETEAWLRATLAEHERYIRAEGIDLPDVRDWRWTQTPNG